MTSQYAKLKSYCTPSGLTHSVVRVTVPIHKKDTLSTGSVGSHATLGNFNPDAGKNDQYALRSNQGTGGALIPIEHKRADLVYKAHRAAE